MPKPIFILAVLVCVCCFSCSTGEDSFFIPEIPVAERHPIIQKQLSSARLWAEQHPADSDALGRFGMILQAYGMYEQAELVYARARVLAPNEFRWAYLHGYTLDVLGQDTQAHDAFVAAARINPKAGRIPLGTALLKLGETAAAREALLKALRDDESNARTLYELGRLESAEGNWATAEGYLSRSAASGAEHPSIYYALGEVKKRQGDEAKAAEYLERFAVARDKGIRWPDQWLAEVAALSLSDRRLMDAAVRAIQDGDIPRAIKLNEQARELNPDNPLPPAALIGLYAIVGDNDKSDAISSIARELDPDSAQFHYNIGLARMAQKRLTEAEDAMLRVTVIDPQGSLAWIKLGTIYAVQGGKEKAIDAFEQAHKRSPANHEVRLKLGVLYVDAQRYESALAMLDAGAVGDGSEAQRLWALGRAHRYLGNVEQATVALNDATAAALKLGDARLATAVTEELRQLNADTAN